MSESIRLLNDTNKKNYSPILILTLLITVLGGSFQFGYQLGAINQPQRKICTFIQKNFKEKYNKNITESYAIVLFSLAVSVLCIGGMLGALCGCRISDIFGRRKCLLIGAFISLSGEIFQGCTLYFDSYYVLIFGRFITGIGCGIFTAIVPLYINEISSPRSRGLTGSLHQIMIIVGILVSQSLGIESILGSTDLWPILLALSGFTAILLLIILPFCPSSPYFLIFIKNDRGRAMESLIRLRGSNDVEDEFMEIYKENSKLCDISKVTVKDFLIDESARSGLFVALCLHVSQQLSGINCVIFYSTSIFVMAGLSNNNASFATISLGFVQLIVCIVSGPYIDRLGRRYIFLISLSGCTISLAILTISLLYKTEWPFFSYVAVIIIIIYIAFFGIGTGSVPWLMTPELFTPNFRDVGISLSVFFNWIANVTVANLYPSLQDKIGAYSFLPFILISSIFLILIQTYCPETTYNR